MTETENLSTSPIKYVPVTIPKDRLGIDYFLLYRKKLTIREIRDDVTEEDILELGDNNPDIYEEWSMFVYSPSLSELERYSYDCVSKYKPKKVGKIKLVKVSKELYEYFAKLEDRGRIEGSEDYYVVGGTPSGDMGEVKF